MHEEAHEAGASTPPDAAATAAAAPPVPELADLPPPPRLAGDGASMRRGRRPRRNPMRLWLLAASAVAVLAIGATVAVSMFGVPPAMAQWLPGAAAAESELIIELPAAAQVHRALPDGVILFEAAGTIVNPTDRTQRVPPILAELRDAQGRIVYSWTINPPVRRLPPGERVRFSEAKVDIPRAAVQLTASWAPDD